MAFAQNTRAAKSQYFAKITFCTPSVSNSRVRQKFVPDSFMVIVIVTFQHVIILYRTYQNMHQECVCIIVLRGAVQYNRKSRGMFYGYKKWNGNTFEERNA